ncbi:VWA domain-containing protein [uncultured Roseobacter sp.]|uniref:vWA domain-containing protein n=1 Tax=uncultured Roseobacter sp. TaxID=114847 RepID=UPI0026114D8A|nr:vWA domain-containing protein [uncultured Roseobacter sp.]
MKKKHVVEFAIVVAVLGVFFGSEFLDGLGNAPETSEPPQLLAEFGDPDWNAIAVWPAVAEEVEVIAQPDPNVTVAVLVLDDSGSMEEEISQAKAALVEAVGFLSETDQVAVIGLNGGVILPTTPVDEARLALQNALRPVVARGGTPLTEAIASARTILENSAAARRSFGNYRIIVTTDGRADDALALRQTVVKTVTETPIQISTIATKSLPDHALNAAGFTSFTTISGVDGLADALRSAVAEGTTFDPITAFEEK